MTESRFTAQYDHFLAKLRVLRSRKGLMQTDMARRLGVPQQYISRFETGETRMDIVQLWQYCKALGVSFSGFCRQLDKEFVEDGVRSKT